MDITLPAIHWLSVLPTLLLAGTAMLALFWDIWVKDEERSLLGWLSFTGIVLTALCSCLLWGRNEAVFSGMFVLDTYALFFNLIFCMAAGLTVLMSLTYLETAEIRHGEYYALILFATLGMVIMAAATDLILIFLG